VDVTKILLAREDIQVNSAIKLGKEKDSTPLIIASYLGRVAIVQLLLNHPDIDLSLRYLNKTALEWAAPNAHSDVFDEDFKESHIDNAISDPMTAKLNFMHVGSIVALAAAVYTIKEQLDTDNYESSGFVLFNAAGVQVDLKIWLFITIAIPLYLLGQVIAVGKDSVGKDSMVLLNTCKANRIKVTKQFTVHTAKLEKDSVEKDSMVLL
jgi:hypothetical protein